MPARLLKEAPPGWAPAVFADRGAWATAKRLLFVRLDTMGDVLMTTPAMRAFKERAPGVLITLLTSPRGGDVARLVPVIDEIVVYEAPWMKASRLHEGSDADRAMADRLRRLEFDAAVIPTVYSQNPLPSAFLCYLADIPLRAAHCHENPYHLLTHWLKDPEPDVLVRHEVQRHLDLAKALGAVPADPRLSLRVPVEAREAARRLFAQEGLNLDEPWVLVHPGSTAPSRCYPVELFERALRLLHHETGAQLVIGGSPDDAGQAGELLALLEGLPVTTLVGKTPLDVFAAVIEAAPLLISNNTGPVHIAAALGTPVVDIYALTNPQHTPWRVPNRVLFHDVPCRLCYKSVCPRGDNACLSGVDPRSVAAAAGDLLGLRAKVSIYYGA